MNDKLGTAVFALALIHTFLTGYFKKWSHRLEKNSIAQNLFEFLGEVEVVFGVWALFYFLLSSWTVGFASTVQYLESLKFNEPLFVFMIMAISSTRPILVYAEYLIVMISKLLPLPAGISFYISLLVLGPLLGSFITEPAAMTVSAFLLRDQFYTQNPTLRFKYLSLATLFVNISIGGVLTHFAAPPVLMVSGPFGWNTPFMLQHFGWVAILATIANASLSAFLLRHDFKDWTLKIEKKSRPLPLWLFVLHLLFLVLVVMFHQKETLCIFAFLFFLGIVQITQEFQKELSLREPLLVAFFLSGIIFFGAFQTWWLKPTLSSLGPTSLFLGATGLTAVLDNAALTYLGTQISLTDPMKFALVKGAVVGGGLTLIANAPNPAGFSIVSKHFESSGFQPLTFLRYALLPTFVAGTLLWFL